MSPLESALAKLTACLPLTEAELELLRANQPVLGAEDLATDFVTLDEAIDSGELGVTRAEWEAAAGSQ